ncbi:MAG: hypothetical protein HC915_04705 [Anaerolineae bacterium]|nr:hypothetical protein [Anaerolineae bacterium]
MATAAPTAQFAGCADEETWATGARFFATQLNGVSMEITAVGIGDFDPQITVLDEEGQIFACNADAEEAAELNFFLPTLPEAEMAEGESEEESELRGGTAGPSEGSALVAFSVGAEERRTFEIIVTNENEGYGEFVLMIEGPSVFPAIDRDVYGLAVSAEQNMNEVPLGVYALNLRLPQNPLNPAVRLALGEGENFEQECRSSSSASLCDGDVTNLTGYTVQRAEDEAAIELLGNDSYLFVQLGGDEPSEFVVEVFASAANTTGPYALLFHTGTGVPNEAME